MKQVEPPKVQSGRQDQNKRMMQKLHHGGWSVELMCNLHVERSCKMWSEKQCRVGEFISFRLLDVHVDGSKIKYMVLIERECADISSLVDVVKIFASSVMIISIFLV